MSRILLVITGRKEVEVCLSTGGINTNVCNGSHDAGQAFYCHLTGAALNLAAS